MSAGTKDGPEDVGRSTEHGRSAAGTPARSPLDEERQASLVDEDGASVTAVESQDIAPVRGLGTNSKVGMVRRAESRRRRPNFWVVAGAIAAGALGVLAMRKKQRQPSSKLFLETPPGCPG